MSGATENGLIPGLPVLLDVTAVAAWLGRTPATVRSMAQRKELPGFKVRGAWRFTPDALAAWVVKQQPRPRPAQTRATVGARRRGRHR